MRKTNTMWLVEALQNDVVNVVFTKADGSTRYMTCTLDPSAIDGDVVNPSPMSSDVEPDTLTVFDMDLGEWRSFKLSRLIEWKLTYPN